MRPAASAKTAAIILVPVYSSSSSAASLSVPVVRYAGHAAATNNETPDAAENGAIIYLGQILHRGTRLSKNAYTNN